MSADDQPLWVLCGGDLRRPKAQPSGAWESRCLWDAMCPRVLTVQATSVVADEVAAARRSICTGGRVERRKLVSKRAPKDDPVNSDTKRRNSRMLQTENREKNVV